MAHVIRFQIAYIISTLIQCKRFLFLLLVRDLVYLLHGKGYLGDSSVRCSFSRLEQ